MSIKFQQSKGYTLGIEVEVQLVDKESLALTHRSTKIIGSLNECHSSIKHELMMSNIEVNTDICSDVSEAGTDLYEKFNILLKEASNHNSLLSLAGSHPFSSWKDQKITENDRYERLLDALQIVARRFNIFGLHVHIGMDGGEKCIYVMNRLLSYLPHFLALSSNSPFWEGEDTGLRSYRSKIFETLPTAGLPFYFKHWKDYTHFVDSYIATGTIETIREIWWDVRPHPDFGTIEVRICDTPQTISEVLAIAALIQALVAKLGNDYDGGHLFNKPHPWIVRENKWRACRYGLDGELITEDGLHTLKTKEAIRNLISFVEPESRKLHSTQYLHSIEAMMAEGDGATRQLEVWKKNNDLKDVVKYLSETLLDDLKKGFSKEATAL